MSSSEPAAERVSLSVVLQPPLRDLLAPLPVNERAQPGELAVYAARSQLPLTIRSVLLPEGAEIEDIIIGNWRKSQGEGFPPIGISIPIYLRLRSGPTIENPTLRCSLDMSPLDTLLPMVEVRAVHQDTHNLLPGRQETFQRSIDFDFVPSKVMIEVLHGEDGVVLLDVRVGHNSLLAAPGTIPASVFTPSRSPALEFINNGKPVPLGMNLTVVLANTANSARTVKVTIEGQGIPPAYDIGIRSGVPAVVK